MDQAIKKQWIAALRSGEYKQGTGCLRNGKEFCCLGVLTDLYAKEKGLIWDSKATENSKSLYGHAAIPQHRVIEWAGLRSCDPGVVVPESIKRETNCDCESLAEMNDRGYTFDQIADVIEEQL